MRLKRVKIFGFKTFADKAEIDLDGDVIAIVGPNGCGKSNIVDAILWGLGEGSPRHLRAQVGQDVIFNGSSRRKALGYAEVTLLFDNEDGFLPIHTSEVSVTRRLNRAGESDYMINRQACRLRDVLDLLADSGLGRSGYAIVGQKDIDQALAASPVDRRAWVDEAAGVQRYRARKVDSLKRLAAAQAHLERVGDILREIEAQREPLRAEAEVARRYKTALGALRSVETGLLIKEVAAAVREVAAQEESVARSMALVAEESSRTERLEARLKETGERIGLIEQEMDTVRGLQQGSLTALERAEAAIRLADQKLESLDNLETNLGEEAHSSEKRILEAQTDLATVRGEEAEESQALDRLRQELSGVDQLATDLRAKLQAAEQQIAAAREAEVRRLRVEAEESHRKQRRKDVRREIAGIRESLPELESGVAEAQGAYEKSKGALATLDEGIRQHEAALSQLQTEEREAEREARGLLAERAVLDGRRRGIEATIEAHEGLHQGARAVLAAVAHGLLKGRYEPVGESIVVGADLAHAIDTALGGAANDLIVDHEADAKAAIEFLKAGKVGRATFQPIPLMRPVAVAAELCGLLSRPGVVGRASELVECDPRCRPVIDSLLGRVVVVETLDIALGLAKTTGWSRMVTLESEVVHSSGAVTGGQTSKAAYGLVQRKADLTGAIREIERLDARLREDRAEGNRRQKATEKLLAELLEARDDRHAQADGAEEDRQWLQNLTDELSSTRRSLQKLERELETLQPPAADPTPAQDLPKLEAERDVVLKELAGRNADAEQAEARLREAELRLCQAQARVYHAERRVAAAEEAAQARCRKIESVEPERQRTLRERAEATTERQRAVRDKAEADARLHLAQAKRKVFLEESLAVTEEAKAARQNALTCTETAHQAELNRARADSRRAASLQRLLEEYGISEEDALEQDALVEVPSDAAPLVGRLRRELRAMGDVNVGAIEAFERLTHRWDELSVQSQDIADGMAQVEASIRELDSLTRDRFTSTFEQLQAAFVEVFQKLFGGGEGSISLSEPGNLLETGIEIDVTLPGKRKQRLELLSGGERALCAAAFLFALLKVRPSPLVVLDEVDAPLDGRNVERFIEILGDFKGISQFIVITHNPTTIEAAPVWLGVTMQEPGVSTLVPARLAAREVAQQVVDGHMPAAPDRAGWAGAEA